MGLASKLQAAQGAGPYGAPPSQCPPGYPQQGGPTPSAPPFPGQSSLMPGQYGAPMQGGPGGFGQSGGQQQGQPGFQGQSGPQAQHGQGMSSQYNMPQQGGQGQYTPSGQLGQPSQFGQNGPNQQLGQYGQQQGHYGQQSGQYGQQPGQYGQQSGFTGGQIGQIGSPFGAQGTFDANSIRNKLTQTIQNNRLQALYPSQVLEPLVQHVASSNLTSFGQKWRLPKEITMDLVALALYDVVLYCDDSGSMAFEEGGERIDDLKMIIGRTADAATLFDTDGISVRFMNSQVEGNHIRSAAEANNLLQQIKFAGTTPLGTSLDRKVLQPLVIGPARSQQLRKPVLIIVITDGEPTGEPRDCVRQVIINSKRAMEQGPLGPGAVAFQFAQVGKDTGAQAFLGSLDTDPQVGRSIDCTSYYENESEEFKRRGIELTPELWLVKLLVGAIDPSYDEQDERR